MAVRLNTRRGGSGEPLVLIHGIGSGLTVWDRMRPALETQHDVIALDLPGFGESPLPEGGCSPRALAEAVAAELDAAGIERAHLVGNSLGGWVALELAMMGRADDVLAISPAGMWTGREARFLGLSLKNMRSTTKLIAPVATTLMRSPAARAAFIQVVSHPWRVPPEAMATAIAAMAGARNFEATAREMLARQPTDLGSIACPVMVAWGTRDYLLLPRQGPRFVSRVPEAELRPLEGLGHAPMLDAPEEVAGLVLEFTARNPTGPAAGTAAAAP